MKDNPVTKYLQNGKDTCVFASIASAHDFLNYKNLAYSVNILERKYVVNKLENINFEKIMGILNHEIVKAKDKHFNKSFQQLKIRNENNFDIINEATKHSDDIFHIVIKGEDNSENHCITVTGMWIFDGNYYNALPLSQISLDECIGNNYIGIKSGYLYKKNKNVVKNCMLQSHKVFDNKTIFTSLMFFLKKMNYIYIEENLHKYFDKITNNNQINGICKDGFGTFDTVMHSWNSGNILQKFQTIRIKEIHKLNIFNLSDDEKNLLYHIIIYSNTNKICICLYNNLIYMSEDRGLLELNQNNINKCLGEIYEGCESGYKHKFSINNTI